MKELSLQEHPDYITNRLFSIRGNDRYLCQCAELKWLFRPHLDEVEIWSAWFYGMKKGEQLPPHRDMEGSIAYVFYLEGSTPIVIKDVEYPVHPGLFITFPSFELHSVMTVTEPYRLSLVINATSYIRPGTDYERVGH